MRRVPRATLLIFVALLIPILPFAVIGELPGEKWLSAHDAEATPFALMGAGLLASDILLPIPSTIVGTLLGARLGFVWGFFSAWVGLMAGATVGFTVGRLMTRRRPARIRESPALLVLFVSRPVPVLAEAVNMICGASPMSLGTFYLVSLPANALFAAALAGNGAALLPDNMAGPGLALPLLLPVVAWLLWKRFRKESPEIAQQENPKG